MIRINLALVPGQWRRFVHKIPSFLAESSRLKSVNDRQTASQGRRAFAGLHQPAIISHHKTSYYPVPVPRLLFGNGPMANQPPIAVEVEVREEKLSRIGPAVDFHRREAFDRRQFNRAGHAVAG